MNQPQGYADGLVVVHRVAYEGTGTRKRRIDAWTLHMADCLYAKRATTARTPAPATPYPNTTDCRYCAPNGEHRRRFSYQPGDGTWVADCRCGLSATSPTQDAARNRLYRLHTERTVANIEDHQTTYVRRSDGSTLATCVCGMSADGPNHGAARNKLYRRHRRAAFEASQT